MKIEQFEDKGLAHFSYAILSECAREIVLIDLARSPTTTTRRPTTPKSGPSSKPTRTPTS